MAFSEIELQRIKKTVGGLCTKKTPEHLRDQLRFDYDVEGQSVVILEIRPVWNNPGEYLRMPMAKLLFVTIKNLWKLYWKRATGKWEPYEPRHSDKDLNVLVKEIENDALGCFFG